MSGNPISKVLTVAELLKQNNLKIPDYQRPYKWTTKNVIQLMDDIESFKQNSSYRLGTVVIHNDDKILNIVDGQQRTVTLILLIKAILAVKPIGIKDIAVIEQLGDLQKSMVTPKFKNDISIKNIQDNFSEIKRRVIHYDDTTIQFLLNKCEVTQFEITDISEAFQFFDSQNSRGKDLEPHDLLKAFHLREFTAKDKDIEETLVSSWEETETHELSELFSEFLFRVKGWSKGNSSRYFTKNHINIFKGISLEKISKDYPYVRAIMLSDMVVDVASGKYPFQLDQIIINGKRFFEMVSHYHLIYNRFKKNELIKEASIGGVALKIFNTIDTYDGRWRTGDRYVRMLFDCALVYYIDKFGYSKITEAVEKIFVWSYNLRLSYQSIQMASVDNYVVREFNLFKVIKDSYTPTELLNVKIPLVDKNQIRSSKKQEIINLLEDLNYYGKD